MQVADAGRQTRCRDRSGARACCRQRQERLRGGEEQRGGDGRCGAALGEGRHARDGFPDGALAPQPRRPLARA